MMGRVRAVPPALWALLAAILVIGGVGLRWELPWLTRDSGVRVSTPVPPARFGLKTVTLKRNGRVCVANLLIPAGADVIGMGAAVGTGHRPPRIDFSLQAPGYRWSGTLPRGWPDGFAPHYRPPAADVIGTLCLSNPSRVPIVINANNEPGAVIRVVATVDGKAAAATPAIEFRVAQPASRLSRLGTMLDRAADFSWRPLSGTIAKLLLALVLLLVPVGAVGALLWTMEADRRREADAAAPTPVGAEAATGGDTPPNAYSEGP
jgi:hypothetical protein